MAGSIDSDANDNNMVKRADSSSSTETDPSHTYLGRRPVPVVSSCQGLLVAIGEFKGDIPFVVELIKKATVDFTESQLVLIQDVFEGARIEADYGFIRQFYNAVYALEESLDLRIKGEKTFFDAQRKRCAEIYEIIRQSSFPFSAEQAKYLHRMLTALYQMTGHPDSDVDKDFMSSMRQLVHLLQMDDHLTDSSPHRFIITSTIHFYLESIIKKLDLLANEEGGRLHPDFIHPHSQIDFAIYLVVNLDALIDRSKVLTPREHFHYGMVEVYAKLVEIFKQSSLALSHRQEVVMQKIERGIRNLKKDPLLSKHFEITEACLEFMTELEENSPDREVKLEGNKVVFAEEGNVNRAVTEIAWNLIYLQPVATEHLRNFSSFGHGVDNVVAKLMERFLALYPLH